MPDSAWLATRVQQRKKPASNDLAIIRGLHELERCAGRHTRDAATQCLGRKRLDGIIVEQERCSDAERLARKLVAMPPNGAGAAGACPRAHGAAGPGPGEKMAAAIELSRPLRYTGTRLIQGEPGRNQHRPGVAPPP